MVQVILAMIYLWGNLMGIDEIFRLCWRKALATIWHHWLMHVCATNNFYMPINSKKIFALLY